MSEFLSPDHFDSYDDIKDRLAYFLDKYNPTAMEKDEFNEIVSEFLGKEVKASNYKSKVQKEVEIGDIDEDEPKAKPKVQKVETEEDEPKAKPKAEKEVKKEVKKEKPKVEDDEDIDSLLADLDD